jgi:hypothetical protein
VEGLTVVGLVALVLIALAFQQHAFAKERAVLLANFAEERQQWVEERRDLNNRIQVPEAAPFLFEQGADDGENDLPVMPDFALDEESLERAKQELAEAGYEQGPAT